MKKILILVIFIMSCSAKYVIPDGKSQVDFQTAFTECQDKVGTKRDNLYIGEYAGIMGIGDDIHNLIVETKFRNCMKEKGYEVQE